jgi:hypothetical protein
MLRNLNQFSFFCYQNISLTKEIPALLKIISVIARSAKQNEAICNYKLEKIIILFLYKYKEWIASP